MWEEQVRRQANFVEGKYKGFRMFFFTEEATKDYHAEQSSMKPRVQGKTKNTSNTSSKKSATRVNKERKTRKRLAESENMSGKGANTSEGSPSPMALKKRITEQMATLSSTPYQPS